MKIIREDLQTGKMYEALKVEGITTAVAHAFMVKLARDEADRRKEVKHLSVKGGSLSGRSTVTLVDLRGGPLIEFRQEWPKT